MIELLSLKKQKKKKHRKWNGYKKKEEKWKNKKGKERIERKFGHIEYYRIRKMSIGKNLYILQIQPFYL